MRASRDVVSGLTRELPTHYSKPHHRCRLRAILTYHSIDDSGSPISLDAATFARHVEFLASGKVEVVPLERLAQVPDERHAAAITFDDGFDNFARLAWPLLRERRLPATLFVATARAGSDNAWSGSDVPGIPRLPLMDWSALRRLASEGLALGSHSRTHPRLTKSSPADLEHELAGSASDLEREIGARPRSFCYPYGDLDERVAAAARRHYTLGCTTELAALGAAPDPLLLPRLDAFYYRSPGRLEAWGSSSFRLHLGLRAAARRARAWLLG